MNAQNNESRIYWVVSGRGCWPYSFAGKNAKRDAHRLARRNGARAWRMTGVQWEAIAMKGGAL